MQECRAAHVLQSDVEWDGDIHFRFNPRKGQGQFILGKFSKFKVVFQKHTFLNSFASELQKCYLFLRTITLCNKKWKIVCSLKATEFF